MPGPALEFEVSDVHAVIVGAADWPSPEWKYEWDGDNWDWDVVQPTWAAGIRSWVWSGSKLLQFKHWPQDF